MLKSPCSLLLALAMAAASPAPADAGCPTCGGGGGGDDSSTLGGGGGAGSPNSSTVEFTWLLAALSGPVAMGADSLMFPSPPETPPPTIVPDDAPPPVSLLLPALVEPPTLEKVFREAKRKELAKTALVQAYHVFSTCSLPPKAPRAITARARPDRTAAIARRPLPKP